MNIPPPQGWVQKELDPDALVAAAHVAAWPSPPVTPRGPWEEVEWLREVMVNVCDTAMPRSRGLQKRAVYWWSMEIARLRTECVRARLQYTYARCRSSSNEATWAREYEGYCNAKKALAAAIRRAKSQVWEELFGTLDRDPWGRPYKIVIRRLRPWAPLLAESLDPQLLRRGATEEEMIMAIQKMGKKNTAPGPDGIPDRVWVLALGPLRNRFRQLLTGCLRAGWFPSREVGRKDRRPADLPSAFRPICLLDEVGKLFERVLAARLTSYLSQGWAPIWLIASMGSERDGPLWMLSAMWSPSRRT
ncbi:uncharacterized protein LOC109855432 [Pseudomyrmex gracilis]|uniref:uncharacterized protein LOC109855432 n=1 Tax=Pseudomyrmex gracilis TaxID=219809 RepID=UPI0009949961|nr:uncharacterized protein LOC109855432 [Pseudomyrmex gracilis]